MLKNFLAAITVTALLMGHIYLCTYTEVPKVILYFVPVLLGVLTGTLANGGLQTTPKIFWKDDQGNLKVSRLAGVGALSFVAYMIFTIIAISER